MFTAPYGSKEDQMQTRAVLPTEGSVGGAPRLFTTRDLVRILRLGEATVRSLLHSGSLPAIKLGVEWRVRAEDLEAFIEQRRSDELSELRDGRRRGRKPGPKPKSKKGL